MKNTIKKIAVGKIYDGIMGLVVGDALGVPVEFKQRDSFKVEDMTGYGTYNQPPGTWLDDSSMTLATLESMVRLKGIEPDDIMKNFSNWLFHAKFTPYNNIFDVGITTRCAIERYGRGVEPLKCGGKSEMDNGNGSLMRILPLAFVQHSFTDIIGISKLTHAHKTSSIACLIYISIVDGLLIGKDKGSAIQDGLNKVEHAMDIPKDFGRHPVIQYMKRDAIKSSGYVVDTLEAALWCLLHGTDYKSTVLMAVNLGSDTDTTAAVAGGLAGIYYGAKDIPQEWITQIARKEWIKELCDKADFNKKR